MALRASLSFITAIGLMGMTACASSASNPSGAAGDSAGGGGGGSSGGFGNHGGSSGSTTGGSGTPGGTGSGTGVTSSGGGAGTGGSSSGGGTPSGSSGSSGGTPDVDGGATGPTGDDGGTSSGSGNVDGGTCCPDGNCLCHGDPPSSLTSMNGSFKTANFIGTTGTIYYPTDATPPLAGIAIIPGFLNTGPEMTSWGPFYASWGFVCVVTSSGAADLPQTRAQHLLAAVAEMKMDNTTSSSPLFGKMADRYGTSGYSMGGGGTTFASETDTTLRSSVGLAAWGPDLTQGIKTPTLFICSDSDTVASCGGSDTAYSGSVVSGTPKMVLDIPGQSHFNWFTPTDAFGESGSYALAFNKVFLDGDTRWKSLLMTMPTEGTMQSTDVH